MHVGGDEVVLECWEEDETLMAWVHAHNTTLPDLFKTFEEQIFAVVRTLGEFLDENVLTFPLRLCVCE